MTDNANRIADMVRGVAAEKRSTQSHIASVLSLSRGSVVARMNGTVPFTASEIYTLSIEYGVPIARFFPQKTEAAA